MRDFFFFSNIQLIWISSPGPAADCVGLFGIALPINVKVVIGRWWFFFFLDPSQNSSLLVLGTHIRQLMHYGCICRWNKYISVISKALPQIIWKKNHKYKGLCKFIIISVYEHGLLPIIMIYIYFRLCFLNVTRLRGKCWRALLRGISWRGGEKQLSTVLLLIPMLQRCLFVNNYSMRARLLCLF